MSDKFVQEHKQLLNSSKLLDLSTASYLADPFKVEEKGLAFSIVTILFFLISVLVNDAVLYSPRLVSYHVPWINLLLYWFSFFLTIQVLLMFSRIYKGWKYDRELSRNSDLRKEVLATLVKRADEMGTGLSTLKLSVSNYQLEFDIETKDLVVRENAYPSIFPLMRSPMSLITECVVVELDKLQDHSSIGSQNIKDFISEVSTHQLILKELEAGKSALQIVDLLNKEN